MLYKYKVTFKHFIDELPLTMCSASADSGRIMFQTIDYSVRVFYYKKTKLSLLLILASNETDHQ